MKYLTCTQKHILANSLALLVLIFAVVYAPISLAEVNNETKLYTQEGYPYGPLVQRIESVKIRYSQQQNEVQCSAEISDKGQTWRSEVRKVSVKSFNKLPLKSCLERDLAKQILATTY
jgi:hypothetical protein